MKRHFFPLCRVASHCRIFHTATGLRLAWQKNPSVSFVPLFPVHDTSVLFNVSFGLVHALVHRFSVCTDRFSVCTVFALKCRFYTEDTIQTKETNKGVTLFSLANSANSSGVEAIFCGLASSQSNSLAHSGRLYVLARAGAFVVSALALSISHFR